MIGVVVAAHGDLAQALLTTAHMVVQDPGHVVAIGVRADDDSASYEARFREAVAAVQQERTGGAGADRYVWRHAK